MQNITTSNWLSSSPSGVELAMALMNRHLSGVETVFVPGDTALAHIASSLVKDVARHGGRIDDLVPAGVAETVLAAVSAERRGAVRPAGAGSDVGTPVPAAATEVTR